MITAVLQARVSSSRFPGKVLKPLLGKPMLQRQIERIQFSKKIDQIIVATSTDSNDDGIESLCKDMGVKCFRGSLENVLDRFYQACSALATKPDHVVRLTGDCPLTDANLIDEVIDLHTTGKYDYTSNTSEPTYPDGLDVELMSYPALEKAWKQATLQTEREHVTYYMYTHPQEFRMGLLKGKNNWSALRWTVDYEEDFQFVESVYKELYPKNPNFTMSSVIQLLGQQPSLLKINSKHTRNEGLEISIMQEFKNSTQAHSCQKSIELQWHAQNRIPGMTQLLSKRPDQFSLGVWPGYYKKAKGVEVWDLDGNKYIDMSIGGIGANVLGYADDDVNAAVIQAVNSGNSSSLNCPDEVELADVLCELHPWASKVRFARSGGEAVTIAIRIARAFTGKDKIAFCGYHGWHDWYLAANLGTENALGEHLLSGLSPKGVPQALAGTALPFRYNQLAELQAHFDQNPNQIAAIIMEPIRSDSPAPGFLEGVKQLAVKNGAVLIFDEISSGFRLNTGGAHLTFGLQPDIAVFSKALGNGYPVAAVVGNDVMQAAQDTFISSTNWTESIGSVAALATIRKHKANNVGAHLTKIGQMVQSGWEKISKEYNIPLHIGGIPPLSHFSFESPAGSELKALYVQFMLEKGFLASTSFYAMFAHQPEHVNSYLSAMDESFRKIADLVKAGKVKETLKGKPSAAGFKRLT